METLLTYAYRLQFGDPPDDGRCAQGCTLSPSACRLEEKLRVLQVPGHGKVVAASGVNGLLCGQQIVLKALRLALTE